MGGSDRDDPWAAGVFLSGVPPDGGSLVGEDGVDRPGDGGDHPFRVDEARRYGEGPLLGWGGMGEVHAVRDGRLNREVAFKRVRGHSATASARLAREAWVTAHLEHPGIVPVYDAGVDDEGRLFYTMRLVRGRTLAAALAEASDPATRQGLLRHVLDAAEAVAYAHSLGVVHRDLKPANIMVGEFGETQVVDWGLALVPDAADRQAWRDLGLPGAPGEAETPAVGTPAYMSPEQARGDGVDARSDVWSLGALIYEVLTGAPPHLGGDTEALLARARQGQVESVLRRAPDAPPELAAIAERALSVDPDARYPTAAELSRELIRWFEGRRVQAYTYTPFDVFRRFVVAWRAPLAVGLVAVLVLVGLGAWTWESTRQERNRALVAEASALEALDQADEALARALVERAWAAATTGARPEAEVLAARSLALRPSPDARGVLAAFTAQRRFARQGPLVEVPTCTRRHLGPGGRVLACLDVDRIALWDLEPEAGEARRRWEVPLAGVTDLIVQPGQDVVGAWTEERLHWLDLATGAAVRSPTVVEGEGAFQQDAVGARPVSARGGSALLVDLEQRSWAPWKAPCTEALTASAGARALDGNRLAIACSDGTLLVGRGLDRRVEASWPTPFRAEHTPSALAWMPDGRRVVLGSLRGGVGLVDVETGEATPLTVGPGGTVRAVVPSPDGRRVAVVAERTGVQIWVPTTRTFVGRLPSTVRESARWEDTETLRALGSGGVSRWFIPAEAGPLRYTAPVGLSAAAPSPDGTLLALARADRIIDVRDVATGAHLLQERREVQEGAHVCKRVAWSPDGRTLLGVCLGEPAIRAYDVATWAVRDLDLSPFARRAGWLVDGLVWRAGYGFRGPELARWRTGEEVRPLPQLAEGAVVDGASTADRSFAVFLGADGVVHLLEAGDPPRLARVTVEPQAGAVSASSGAERIAIARRRDVVVIDRAGQVLQTLTHPETRPLDVALTPDGRRLVTASRDGVARVYDVDSGAYLARLQGHDERISSVEVSADGTEVFTASWDGSVYRWGLEALDQPVDEVIAEVETAWALTLDAALAAPLR